MDCMDLLILLERLDPSFQEHMRRARPRVLWAISSLQGWVRGMKSRAEFTKRKLVVTQIQRRWRGTQTRRKLLGMLHMHKWRRRQVNTYFLPKTADERRAVQQKCKAMLAAKDVTHRAANASLRELHDTILQSSTIDEDVERTRETLVQGDIPAILQSLPEDGPPGAMSSTGRAGGPSPYTSHGESSRFQSGIAGAIAAGPADRGADLSQKDIRKIRDTTLRQISGIDG